MPKVKDYEEKLTAKEILQAFVSTLSDKNCKEAYRLLRERYDKSKVRMLTLNREGVPVVDGLVRLRPKEMETLLATEGEYKFHWKVAKLYDWLAELSERAKIEVPAKRMWKQYTKISHFYRIQKGWVDEAYQREATPPPQAYDTVDFYNITSEEEALRYLQLLPPHLRIGSPEVEFLTLRYPKLKEAL